MLNPNFQRGISQVITYKLPMKTLSSHDESNATPNTKPFRVYICEGAVVVDSWLTVHRT